MKLNEMKWKKKKKNCPVVHGCCCRRIAYYILKLCQSNYHNMCIDLFNLAAVLLMSVNDWMSECIFFSLYYLCRAIYDLCLLKPHRLFMEKSNWNHWTIEQRIQVINFGKETQFFDDTAQFNRMTWVQCITHRHTHMYIQGNRKLCIQSIVWDNRMLHRHRDENGFVVQ